MNVEIFKRNVQLAKLGIAELDGDEKTIYDFLVDNLSNLNTYTSDGEPDWLYFGKTIDTIVLSYDSQKECLCVIYQKIWSFFSANLSMEYPDLHSLMRWWVIDTLDLKLKHIQLSKNITFVEVTDTLDLKLKHINPANLPLTLSL